MNTIKEQFDNVTLMKIFEVAVIDKRTNKEDYIIFDIEIEGNNFVATHIGLTEEQEKSSKIAFLLSEIDEDFSLDENLQELYNDCLQAILDSEFYELTND